MTDLTTIPAAIAALEARAKKLDRWAMPNLVASSAGWSVHCAVLKAPLFGFGDPFEALDALDAALAKLEDRDGNLARTLGIETANGAAPALLSNQTARSLLEAERA
jgi:hypothetical protein